MNTFGSRSILHLATTDTDAIRRLNDALRTTGIGGQTVFVGALGQAPEDEKQAV